MMRTAICLFSLLAFTACTAETPEESGTGGAAQGAMEQAQEAADTVANRTIATPEVHDAKCGCKIEGIGRCGNYVMLGDEWTAIEWSELGHMEWCAKGEAGAKVEIAGAMDGDKFVATSYREVE